MSGFVGVIVFDPWVQSQFMQLDLRVLHFKFIALKRESGHVTFSDMPPLMEKLKGLTGVVNTDEIRVMLEELYPDMGQEVDFERLLREYLNLQALPTGKSGTAKTFRIPRHS